MENQHFTLQRGYSQTAQLLSPQKAPSIGPGCITLGSWKRGRDRKQKSKDPPHPICDRTRCQRKPVCVLCSSRDAAFLLCPCMCRVLSLRCNKLAHWKIPFYLPGKLDTGRLCFEIHILTTNYIALSLWCLCLCQVASQSRLWSAHSCFFFPRKSLSLSVLLSSLLSPRRKDANWAW